MRRLVVLAALVVSLPAGAVTMDWVYVGNPGNAPDVASHCLASDCGSVEYGYYISKHEVTNAQYAEFLNAKAASDPFDLYNPNMGDAEIYFGGITRSGAPGSYTYAVTPGFENRPVVHVSFYDALRFANWLHNGQGSGDTEAGAYTITAGGIAGNTILRNTEAITFLPSENEWYKAAYYGPSLNGGLGGYFAFPAGSSGTTICASPTANANRANCGGAVLGLTEVGAYTGSPSPHGTFDQGGNVGEWNEQIQQLVSGSFRGLRGGAWAGGALTLAASSPGYSTPVNENYLIGFRVASLVPEPGTALLVMVGLLGLVARGRHRA